MDTTRRTILKAITWQAMGVITMSAISYPHTGSLTSALSLALNASGSGFVFFLVHEMRKSGTPFNGVASLEHSAINRNLTML